MTRPTTSSPPHRKIEWPRLLALIIVLAAIGGVLTLSATSCRKRPESVTTTDQRPAFDPGAPEPSKAIAPPIPDQAWTQDRWLKVITPDPKAPGGWAEASFDKEKNKLIIVARDVKRFVIKTDIIGIDWDRRVILSLNHANSELRRRDETVLTFDLDRHGQWVVLEPPASRKRK